MSLPSLPGACRKWGVQVYGPVWLGGIPYTSVLPPSVCSASCRPLLWGEETEVRSTGQKLRKHITTPLAVVYPIAEIEAVNWKWPTKIQTVDEMWYWSPPSVYVKRALSETNIKWLFNNQRTFSYLLDFIRLFILDNSAIFVFYNNNNKKIIYIYRYIYIYICNSAVNQLIMINRIHNKSFICIMCVLCIFIMYI